jgi:hypothetical protein
VAEVDLDELMRCLGWRNGGRSGEYIVYEPRVEGWLIPGVRIYVKSRREEGGCGSTRDSARGWGSRLEFVLYVKEREWRFRGRQSGLVNLLGRGYVEEMAKVLTRRILDCLRQLYTSRE